MKTYHYGSDDHDFYETNSVLATSVAGVKGSGGANPPEYLTVKTDRPKIAVENFFLKREWTTLRFQQLTMAYHLCFRRFHDAFSDFLETAIFTDNQYLPNIASVVKDLKKEYHIEKNTTPKDRSKDAEATQYYEDTMKRYGLDPKYPIPHQTIPLLAQELTVGKTIEKSKPIVEKSMRFLENYYALKQLTGKKDDQGKQVYPFDTKKFNIARKAFESSYGAITEQRIFDARDGLTIIFSSALDDMLTKFPWFMIYDMDRCNTAWTDGKSIGISPIYFEMLTNEEIQFVILHECFHCVFSHMRQGKEESLRIEKEAKELRAKYEKDKLQNPNMPVPLILLYNHQLMNVAMDHEVNNFIKHSLFGGDPEKRYVEDTAIMFDDDAIPGQKASEMTAIDVYRILVKQLEATQHNNGGAIINPHDAQSSHSIGRSKKYINKNIY